MAAARGGAAEVVAVDESAVAMEVGAECARANGLAERIRFVREDARARLPAGLAPRRLRPRDLRSAQARAPRAAPRTARSAPTRAWPRRRAARRKPGGILVLCSCSSAVSLDELTRALALGARDARMQAIVFERHFQGGGPPGAGGVPRGPLPEEPDRARRGALT